MAKIPTTRLNSSPDEYEKTDFDQLIADIQEIIKLLNSTYPKDIQDDEDRKGWFLMRGN